MSIKDLKVYFELRRFGFGHAGYVRAVDDVTFDVKHGEAIAVVGESGCGKSSLMKTILGLYRPTEGKVVFEGKDLGKMDARVIKWYRTQVGYVQQDPYGALPPFMNVQKILSEPLIIGGVRDKVQRDERINKVMTDVKMTPVSDFINKFPHMLSGGQQQRMVIARAMIMEPKFLVADEPVSMLDASVRVEILKLLRNLQERYHFSVIYITHDLSTVRYFSERVFVMYAGKIIEKARIADLLRNPLHPYADALLAATSEPDAKNATTYKDVPPGEPPSLVNPPSGCRFHPRCPKIIKGLCEVQEPPDFNPEPEHTVLCWLYK
ncbi:MAG: oligopeptide ABC transporter ATP-binding protein [Chloroflexi bacterium RBG_13_50_21]|nr:MAG: oligopeptide ABC transporter ATP-binding protein [Chloroflexi bacterium RBG_13_50_21]